MSEPQAMTRSSLRVVRDDEESQMQETTPDVFSRLGVERWVEEEGDLARYENPSAEGVESEWAELDSDEDRLNLRRGALVHAISLNRVYGHSNLRAFAGKTGADVSNLYDWLATYRRISNLSEERRRRVLALDVRYSHLRVANVVKDDVAYEDFLTRASDERWIVGRLASAVAAWRTVEPDLGRDQGRDYDEPYGNSDSDSPAEQTASPTDATNASETSKTSGDTSETPEFASYIEGGSAVSEDDSGGPRTYDDGAGITERDAALIRSFLTYAEEEDVELGVWTQVGGDGPLEFLPLDNTGDSTKLISDLVERYLKDR